MSVQFSFELNPAVKFGASNRNAFGLFRVGQSAGIYEHKSIHSKDATFMREKIVGGATITYLPAENQVALNVTTLLGDRAIRESPYCPYIAGNAQEISPTVVLAPAKVGMLSRVGYYNDSDGPFFEQNATDLRCVIRSSVSGSISDALFFTRDQWDDKLDGTGPSRKTVDFTKGFLPIIEIAWQGYVGVRFGVEIEGERYYCKTYNHSGIVPFMATPTLPCRYEILNTAMTASASTMKECCLTVRSHGGSSLPGLEYSVDNFFITGGVQGTLRNVTTLVPILAIRMANTFGGKPNRRLCRLIASSMYAQTNSARAIVYHVHSDYTAVVGGTWQAIHPDSAIEVNTGLTSITLGTLHPVHMIKTPVGVGNSTAVSPSHADVLNYHSQISNNIDATLNTGSEMFVMFAASLASPGGADVCGTFDLLESE